MKSTPSQRKEMIFLALLALVAITLVTVALVPSLRKSAKEALFQDERVILAKAVAKLSGDETNWTVLKIKKSEQIQIEIYRPNEEGQLTLLTTLPLEDRKDGHFIYQGNAVNLAVVDVDKDGTVEIVAPSYSDQLVPRLNIFRYNKSTDSFDRATAPADFNL